MAVETASAPSAHREGIRREGTRVKVKTLLRGEIEVDERHIVEFVSPLVGFETLRRFVVYQTSAGPLSWLQSIDDPEVAFAILSPFAAGLDPDYAVGPVDLAEIGAESVDDVAVYTMVVLDKDRSQTRTNLRAPILISNSTARAKQVIFDDPQLPIRHYLRGVLGARPGGAAAGR